VQRGNNRQPIFFEAGDNRAYLDWLQEGLERYDCALHAYVLMTNHVHLLLSPKDRQAIGRLIQYVGRRYVPYINHAYGRTGTLWEGRYKASLVQDERYLLACMRYIELNPVRAGMVKSAAQYRWSSYRANAQGREDGLITAHERYRALGRSIGARRARYRALFKGRGDKEGLETIRSAWRSGTPLGNDRFRATIEQALQTKVGYAKRGRPRKLK
jgi:putative transposase